MKNNYSKIYFVITLFNILLCSIIAILFEVFLIYIVSKLQIIYELTHRYEYLEFLFKVDIYSVIIYFVVGIVAFSIPFYFLEKRFINTYIHDRMKIMQEEINKLAYKESENEKAKQDLITNVAHDLRTPLTSIIGYLELLKNKQFSFSNADDESVFNKYVDIVFNKSKRLQELIEELFSFTKTNYGKESIVLSKIDLVSLIEQLLEEMYPLFNKNNLVYKFSTKEKIVYMNADGNLLARLFENLLTNAIKYGIDGKQILIKLKKVENDFVQVDVINFGKIIPKEDISKIFEQFYRTDKARQSSTGGSGLGLPIAQNIAVMHGGNITVTSNKKGTNFSILLKTNLI